jgi:hypothetical protein
VPAPSQLLTTFELPVQLGAAPHADPGAWKLQTPVSLQPASVQLLAVQLQQRAGVP